MIPGWTLGIRIASGTTSEVYLVTHESGLAGVAKILRAPYRKSVAARARLRSEAQVLQEFNSPFMPRVLDLDVSSKSVPYLVLSYDPHSETLSVHLKRRGSLIEAHTLEIAEQIALACQELHAVGYVHADIKPANVLIGRNQSSVLRVKLIDFGSVVRRGHAASAAGVGGTPAFMSPEQAQGLPLDEKSDVYSLGAVMFTLSTGEHISADSCARDKLEEFAMRNAAHDTTCLSLSPEIQDIILNATAHEPAQRYASMEDFKRAITFCKSSQTTRLNSGLRKRNAG